jgi:CDP-paratose 2-epimerase
MNAGSAPPPCWGVSERIVPGDRSPAERLLEDLGALPGVPLRLVVARADWEAPEGRAWYRWLVPELAAGRSLVLALHRSPGWPCGSRVPPAFDDAAGYRRFVTEIAGDFDACGAGLELADVLGPSAWPDFSGASLALLQTLDRDLPRPFCIGGLPLDPVWRAGADPEALPAGVSALAFSHLPEVRDWPARLGEFIGTLPPGREMACWLTPDGCSGATERPPDTAQLLRACAGGAAAGAERVFFGRPRAAPGRISDRDEHSLRAADGRPSLLARWLGGSGATAVEVRLPAPAASRDDAELVIGGAGFVGCNMAARLAQQGRRVVVFDDLSRPGTEHNADWLLRSFPDRVELTVGDVRDFDAVRRVVDGAARIFHFAAQVAVTTSLEHPHHDHEINALGTLNVLEAVRRLRRRPPLLFTSTNKVYGGLEDIPLVRTERGYEPEDEALRRRGIAESRPLAFCSPYGCSKGAADQYVLDYAHTFGLPAAVLRMSCIYGPRQFGNEDQGWVAHFVRQVLLGQPITLYGDGHQVRDVLYVDDLVDAALAVTERASALAGEAFNVGGGPANVLSLHGLLRRLAELHGELPPVQSRDWRPSDQRYYASDISRIREATGWAPRVGIDAGVPRLYGFLMNSLGEAGNPSGNHRGRMAL